MHVSPHLASWHSLNHAIVSTWPATSLSRCNASEDRHVSLWSWASTCQFSRILLNATPFLCNSGPLSQEGVQHVSNLSVRCKKTIRWSHCRKAEPRCLQLTRWVDEHFLLTLQSLLLWHTNPPNNKSKESWFSHTQEADKSHSFPITNDGTHLA